MIMRTRKLLVNHFGKRGAIGSIKRNEDDTVGLHFKVGSDRFWFVSWNPYPQTIVFFKLQFAELDSV